MHAAFRPSSGDAADLEHVGAAGVAHGLAAGDGIGVAGHQHAALDRVSESGARVLDVVAVVEECPGKR